MVLLIQHPPGRAAERSYIFDVLFREFLGLDYISQSHSAPDVRISLVGDGQQKRLEIAEVLFATPDADWLKSASLPKRPLPVLNHTDPLLQEARGLSSSVPVVYGHPRNGRWFSRSDKEVYIGLDILGSAFFLLTRYEEVAASERDSWDRFPASASLAFQEQFLLRPLVNECLEILWLLLCYLWPGLKRRARAYRFLLSHDVDSVSINEIGLMKVLRSLGADMLMRREPLLAFRRLGAWCMNCFTDRIVDFDPYNTFDFIMETSESSDIRSAFNFQVGLSHHTYDARYKIGAPWTRQLLRRIHERGHEIGFHPSYNTYDNETATRMEHDCFRKVCAEEEITQPEWGGRQHCLRWTNPVTWQNWECCSLDYDSSLSFAQHVGFRCACCYEYPVMNLRTRRRLKLRERPLVVMDITLLSYMACSLEAAEQKVYELAATCRRYQGDFALLWHNSMLASASARQAYRRIIRAAGSAR